MCIIYGIHKTDKGAEKSTNYRYYFSRCPLNRVHNPKNKKKRKREEKKERRNANVKCNLQIQITP